MLGMYFPIGGIPQTPPALDCQVQLLHAQGKAAENHSLERRLPRRHARSTIPLHAEELIQEKLSCRESGGLQSQESLILQEAAQPLP